MKQTDDELIRDWNDYVERSKRVNMSKGMRDAMWAIRLELESRSYIIFNDRVLKVENSK